MLSKKFKLTKEKLKMKLKIRSQFCHEEVNGARGQILPELHINCIPETSIETWESCKEEVIKIIKNKLDITDDIEIDHCHSMGKFQRNESKSQLSLSFYISKINTVLQNAKKIKKTTGIFIYKDFCKVTMELRKFVGSFTVLVAKQNSTFKLQKHCCQ